METFQKTVLFSAIVVLVISLISMGIILSYAKDEQWPPIMSVCPDYWSATKDGKCENVKDLGVCKENKSMDFKDYDLCAKYKWAQKCQVTWDGLNNNPCT